MWLVLFGLQVFILLRKGVFFDRWLRRCRILAALLVFSFYFVFLLVPVGLWAFRTSVYPVDPGSAARAVSRLVAPGPSLFSLCSFVLIKNIPAYGLVLGSPLVQRLLPSFSVSSPVMYKLAILGDQPLVTLVSTDSFRDKLGFSFTTHPISTMVALSMFKASFPTDANVAVIGCLTSLLSDISVPKTEKNREVYLSMFVRLLCSALLLLICFFCFSRAVLDRSWRVGIGSVAVPRGCPGDRGASDSSHSALGLQVRHDSGSGGFWFSSVSCLCCPLLPSLQLCLQPHLSALSLGDPRVRVFPHFAMDSGMLSSNGSTMTTATSSKFREFIMDQLLDALAYFEMWRVPLEITLDENSNEAVRKLHRGDCPGG